MARRTGGTPPETRIVEWHALRERHDGAVAPIIDAISRARNEEFGRGFSGHLDGPARAICATAMLQPLGIAVRSGLHTGEIELTADDVTGIDVHIAARVAAEAETGETVVSSTVRDLVAGSGLRFENRGVHALRGLPNDMHLYTVARPARAGVWPSPADSG